MKKLSIIIAMIVLPWVMNAQTIDMERMDRDIEIAENILSTLSNQKSGQNLFFGNKAEGNYIEGYGVIFYLPKSTALIYQKRGTAKHAWVAPNDEYSYSVRVADAIDESDVEKEREQSKKVEISEGDWIIQMEHETQEQMKLFLVDYASLIGQLKNTDKIMITTRGPQREAIWLYNNGSEVKGHSNMYTEIDKSELIAYERGELTRDEVMKKIIIKTNKESKNEEKDIEVFTGVISRLYEPDISQTYYSMRHSLSYERLENIGVIFNMKMYSSNSDNGLHIIRTTGESGLTQEERDKKVAEMYPAFELSLKENILDYGRTIRSLKPNEVLLFKVKLTECRGCDMPKSIEITVKASLLSEYNSGKLSRNDAIEKVVVKKNK